MKIVNGWHCPDLLSGAGKYMKRAIEDAPAAILRCERRRVAIQAGGHVGTWPVYLSGPFERIYTFEPTSENFRCLVKNVEDHAADPGRIFAARGALGNKRGPIDMVLSRKSTGQHRAHAPKNPNIAAVPCYRIDDLNFPVVDALFLDLEGFENFALRGAAETLTRCRPVVMAENNRRAADQGFKRGDLAEFMATLNYQVVHAAGEDLIFQHRGEA